MNKIIVFRVYLQAMCMVINFEGKVCSINKLQLMCAKGPKSLIGCLSRLTNETVALGHRWVSEILIMNL